MLGADMDETMAYGFDEQVLPNSYLDATVPYGTTSLLVPSADMNETLTYRVDVQILPHSNILDTTMPYEVTGHKGHKLQWPQPERPKTEIATNWNGQNQ